MYQTDGIFTNEAIYIHIKIHVEHWIYTGIKYLQDTYRDPALSTVALEDKENLW